MTESEQTDKHHAEKKNNPEKTPQSGQGDKSVKSGDKAAPKKPATPAPAKKPAKSGGRGAVLLALFALLVALAAAAGVGAMWYWGQIQIASIGERVDTVERGLESSVQDVVLPKLQKLAAAQDELKKTNSQQKSTLGSLAQSLTRTRVQVGELTEKVEGGRRRWRLLEIEDLLLAANERLLLYKDAGGAQQALDLASRRLGQLNDPRLFKIREQVIDEIAALNALPKPDIEGMALALTSLIEQLPDLPLARHVSSDYNSTEKEDDLSLGQEPWHHFVDSMRAALASMVTIRREKTDYEPLMPVDQKFFLMQNLQLKLQSARLSLLQRESQSYSAALAEARDWLNKYLDVNDPAVAGAIQSIGQMQKIELDWEVPDITASLEAMRSYLRAQTGEKAPADKSRNQTDSADAAAGSE